MSTTPRPAKEAGAKPALDVVLHGPVRTATMPSLAALREQPLLRLAAVTAPLPDHIRDGWPSLPIMAAEELATRHDVDAVVVTEPTDDELLMELIGSGKHVLIDPGTIPTVADAERLLRLADDGHGSVLPALPHRFSHEARTVGSLVNGGKLGEVVFARAAFLDVAGSDRGHRTRRPSRVDGVPGVTAEAAAAAVLDVANQWFTGSPTVIHSQRGPAGAMAPGYVVTTARFDGGPTVICESQVAAPEGQPSYRELFLQGKTGMASFPWDVSPTMIVTDGVRPLTPTANLAALRRLVDDWAATVLGYRPASVAGDDLAMVVGFRHAISWSLQHDRATDAAAFLAGERELA